MPCVVEPINGEQPSHRPCLGSTRKIAHVNLTARFDFADFTVNHNENEFQIRFCVIWSVKCVFYNSEKDLTKIWAIRPLLHWKWVYCNVVCQIFVLDFDGTVPKTRVSVFCRICDTQSFSLHVAVLLVKSWPLLCLIYHLISWTLLHHTSVNASNWLLLAMVVWERRRSFNDIRVLITNITVLFLLFILFVYLFVSHFVV